MKPTRWTLAQKLLAAFGLLSLITLAQALFVWSNIRFVDDQLVRTVNLLIPQSQRIADLETSIITAESLVGQQNWLMPARRGRGCSRSSTIARSLPALA